jgi:hypothetical protein
MLQLLCKNSSDLTPDAPAVNAMKQPPEADPKNEKGQAATEYAILAMWTVIIVLASIKALEVSLIYYYQDIASLISLPIP